MNYYRVDTNERLNDELYEKLYHACRHGSLDEVQQLAKRRGVNINKRHPYLNLWTPVYAAVRNNNIDVVRFLVTECDADINIPGADGYTPLMDAVANNFENMVVLLIELNANPFAKTYRDGFTARDIAEHQNADNLANLLEAHEERSPELKQEFDEDEEARKEDLERLASVHHHHNHPHHYPHHYHYHQQQHHHSSEQAPDASKHPSHSSMGHPTIEHHVSISEDDAQASDNKPIHRRDSFTVLRDFHAPHGSSPHGQTEAIIQSVLAVVFQQMDLLRAEMHEKNKHLNDKLLSLHFQLMQLEQKERISSLPYPAQQHLEEAKDEDGASGEDTRSVLEKTIEKRDEVLELISMVNSAHYLAHFSPENLMTYAQIQYNLNKNYADDEAIKARVEGEGVEEGVEGVTDAQDGDLLALREFERELLEMMSDIRQDEVVIRKEAHF